MMRAARAHAYAVEARAQAYAVEASTTIPTVSVSERGTGKTLDLCAQSFRYRWLS
jgi:hypothetical protein